MLTDESLMSFGKHKGEKLANVPAGYLIYMYDMGYLRGELKRYCEENIEVLKIQKRREDEQNKNNYNR